MFTRIDPEAIRELGSLSFFPIMEFTVIAALTIISYVGINAALKNLHPATKTIVAMLMATIAYSISKYTLVTMVLGPTAQAVAY